MAWQTPLGDKIHAKLRQATDSVRHVAPMLDIAAANG
jgi:hypothetical protein